MTSFRMQISGTVWNAAPLTGRSVPTFAGSGAGATFVLLRPCFEPHFELWFEQDLSI